MINKKIFNVMRNPVSTWIFRDEWVIIQVSHNYNVDYYNLVEAWNTTDRLPVKGAEPYKISWATLAKYTYYEEFDGMDSFHLVKRIDLEKIGLE